ncbi:MAG TPA: hypothetical protein VH082_12870, partial [Rudaea sp.]|nr:hypothetical protein [Rudaea sp.]
LSGPGYRVVPEVRVRGYMANFLIDTTFGPLRADSVELLSVRISEVPAMEALDRASRTDAFSHAIAERGRKTGVAILHVVEHPVDTITGLPLGVVRYINAKWKGFTDKAESLSDRGTKEFENKGDAFRAPTGPMTADRDEPLNEGYPPDKKSRAWYSRAESEGERETKRYLKYSAEKRDMVKLLGVDPNSTNPILNDKLDELAWAAVWGNFSAGAALGVVTGGAADVVTWTGRLNQYVLEKTPEDLREENRTRLVKFCSDDFAVRQFLRRGGFTDTLRTALAQTYEKLKPESGCNELVELAATTRGEVEARYLTDALKMIQKRIDAGSGKLLVVDAAVVWQADDGKIVLPLPVDYLTWSHDIGDFFNDAVFKAKDRVALIGGDASPLAMRKLTERGWSIVVHAPFDGAPNYAQKTDFNGAADASY